jgi:hypothetical protein
MSYNLIYLGTPSSLRPLGTTDLYLGGLSILLYSYLPTRTCSMPGTLPYVTLCLLSTIIYLRVDATVSQNRVILRHPQIQSTLPYRSLGTWVKELYLN